MAENRTWLAVDPRVHEKLQAVSAQTGYTIRDLTDEIIDRFATIVYVQKLVERRRSHGPLSRKEQEIVQEFAPLVAMMAALCDALDGRQSPGRRAESLFMLHRVYDFIRDMIEPRDRGKH